VSTKKSKTKSTKQCVRRRLVGVLLGDASVIGRYSEDWLENGVYSTHMTYGANINLYEHPELYPTVKAAKILMDVIERAICETDKKTKPEL